VADDAGHVIAERIGREHSRAPAGNCHALKETPSAHAAHKAPTDYRRKWPSRGAAGESAPVWERQRTWGASQRGREYVPGCVTLDVVLGQSAHRRLANSGPVSGPGALPGPHCHEHAHGPGEEDQVLRDGEEGIILVDQGVGQRHQPQHERVEDLQ
jgi:hypothetical protein